MDKMTYAPQEPQKEKKGSKGRTILGIASAVVLLIMIISIITNDPDSTAATKAAAAYDKQVKIVADACSITPEQAAHVVDIIQECGLQNNITEVKHFINLDDGGKVYEMKVGGDALMLVLTAAGDVDEINLKKSDIQFYADGDIQYRVFDYDTKEKYIMLSRGIVGRYVSFPQEAKWAWGDVFEQKGFIYAKSSVEVKNAFGVKSTVSYQVKFDKSGSPVSVIIDGKEYL